MYNKYSVDIHVGQVVWLSQSILYFSITEENFLIVLILLLLPSSWLSFIIIWNVCVRDGSQSDREWVQVIYRAVCWLINWSVEFQSLWFCISRWSLIGAAVIESFPSCIARCIVLAFRMNLWNLSINVFFSLFPMNICVSDHWHHHTNYSHAICHITRCGVRWHWYSREWSQLYDSWMTSGDVKENELSGPFWF